MPRVQRNRAWVVTVNMGYGHQRATAPLASLSPTGKAITANDYEGIPEADKLIWDRSESFYYFISRLKDKNALGRFIFSIFDKYQNISEFHPLNKEVAPTLQLRKLYAQLKHGWGKHLIEKLSRRPLPLITSFFSIAYMAEYFNYPGQIYLIVTDSDISRAWAPLQPSRTRIKYLAPTDRAAERLKTYGVKTQNIIYTGFPLPCDLVGRNSSLAKKNLKNRIARLDPEHNYTSLYSSLLTSYLGKSFQPPTGKHNPVSLAFVVGGAGAQVNIGIQILKSLGKLIRENKIHLYLVAGVSEKANQSFLREISRLRLGKFLGKSLYVVFRYGKEEYFSEFDKLLAKLDVLWTKPSELSFYGALGLPIIIAPPVGSQEIQNRRWLLNIGVGMDQLSPSYAQEWLPKIIKEGRMAGAAMQGFIEMERCGTENIIKIIKR
ncbi:MAG TPA: hypothetical protein VJL32_00215 [Candidatus Paceibacterota bacterium]